MKCLLIADDVTGACDAAVPFRSRGAATRLELRDDPKPCEVHAISTNSRGASECEIRARLRAIAERSRAWRPDLVFKKIDSLLRGSPGAEIAAARDAFGYDYAVITPAFPAMGRTVAGGHLHVAGIGEWEPVHVAERIGMQCSADAFCDADLDAIVADGLASGKRVLWAGSAGLSSALARALYPAAGQDEPPPKPGDAPVLFCIGSDHAVTAAQVADLSRRRANHVILRIPRDASMEELRHQLTSARTSSGGILLTGGDTAALVLRAAGAGAIELEGEIVTGLPWGRIEGGVLDGLPVATKSGAFGAPDALTRVADFFTL